jgi:hypothetical protein
LSVPDVVVLYGLVAGVTAVFLAIWPQRVALVTLIITLPVLGCLILLWRVGVHASTYAVPIGMVRGGPLAYGVLTLIVMLGGVAIGASGLVVALYAEWSRPLEAACLCGGVRRLGALALTSLVVPWLAGMEFMALSGLVGGSVAFVHAWQAWRRRPA